MASSPDSGSEPDRTELLDVLAEVRARTSVQVVALAHDLDEMFAASELVSTDDEHDPEGATIAYERAQLTALLAQAREDLAVLDRALETLDAGDEIHCAACGEPIAVERLLALPTARTCIACAPH
jgi:RNA polymerase-binding transcription factor